MQLSLNGRTVYRIGVALKMAGVSRATFFRWVKNGRIKDARYKDRNRRRVLTEEEVKLLTDAANILIETDSA